MSDATRTPPGTGAVRGGPFAGVTVVEVGQFVVVPVCAMYLAQGGARVIKIEPIAGDPYRSSHPIAPMESRHFLAKNRGKESVALDLQSVAAREVIDRLMTSTDVFLTNMRPESIDRRGLSYERLSGLNRRLVYGVASGYGHVGPERDLPGFDVIAQARSGLLHALRAEHGGLPFHSKVQVADFSAAMILFAGVASALYERERTGVGQKVEASLLAGALSLQGNSVHHVEAVDGWRRQFVEPTCRDSARRVPRSPKSSVVEVTCSRIPGSTARLTGSSERRTAPLRSRLAVQRAGRDCTQRWGWTSPTPPWS